MKPRSTLPALFLVNAFGALYAFGHEPIAVFGLGIIAVMYAVEADIARGRVR